MGSIMSVPHQEPTMEEILAAVRKIIAKDDPPESVSTPPEASPREAAHKEAEEIIFERKVPAAPSADDIYSDHTRATKDKFDSIPDESDPFPLPLQDAVVGPDGSSVESAFERAVRESFDPVLKNYLGDNSKLVIECMKPLVRAWMDENFPPLLKNAVREDVERIVKTHTRHE